jgi:hypothetical protein
MKTLRRLCAVAVLTVALSFSASAGEISTPGITQTSQSKTTTTTSAATETCNLEPGEISTPGAVLDPLTEAALSLLQSLFSIF